MKRAIATNEFLNRLSQKKTEDETSNAFWDEIIRERYQIALELGSILDDGFKANGNSEFVVRCEKDEVILRRGEDWMRIECNHQDCYSIEYSIARESLAGIVGTKSHHEPIRTCKEMFDDVIRWSGIK